METIHIGENIVTLCERAKPFPTDVKGAFERLAAKVNGFEGRTMYGISYWENDGLQYLAACSAKSENEAKELGTQEWTIKAGDYLSETIENWQGNEHLFEPTFKKLGHSDNHTELPGVEWYFGNDVKCMLPIKNNKL